MNEPDSLAGMGPPAHGNSHEHEREPSRLAYVGRFLRHLVEMILAMMLGMAVWGAILGLILTPIGYGDVVRASPELRFGVMAFFMSVPMVLLMRYRGHTWERGIEMAAAMVAPMGVVVLCWRLGTGAYIPFFSEQALSASTHVAMYLGMILLMLYRHKEYAHSHGASHMSGAQASA
jgi:hypothetical protein